MDGTDFRINRPVQKARGWYSHKTNSSGTRYQIAVSIPTGLIVHIDGPYPAGHWPDIKIYRRLLKYLLLPGEMVLADLGYRGDSTIITPDDVIEPDMLQLMSNARARHEGINGMFKMFRILRDIYRHDRSKHESIFKCVAVLVQLRLKRGEGTYDITNQGITLPAQGDGEFLRGGNEVRNVQVGLADGPILLQVEVDQQDGNDHAAEDEIRHVDANETNEAEE